MKTRLLIGALSAILNFSSVNAEELFKDCSDIVDDNSYRPLQKYLSSNNVEANYCQQLNSHEFLFTTRSNIYYCKSDNDAELVCNVSDKNGYPELSIIKRFTGGKGKQFVLFNMERLSQGLFEQSYLAFCLVPKKINPAGYKVFFFSDAGSTYYVGDTGICAGENVDVGLDKVTSSSRPEIINEGQSTVIVRYYQDITDCKTNIKSKQILEYTWMNDTFSFKQTKNQISK